MLPVEAIELLLMARGTRVRLEREIAIGADPV